MRSLRKHSRLPGPRANLELAQAAADVGNEKIFRQWIKAGSGNDPTDEFVAMCGVVGLGRLVAEGNERFLDDLQAHASDPRWRVREAVVLGLQRLGDRNIDVLLRVVDSWAGARPFVQRAAIGAVSEPRLLKTPVASRRAADLIDRMTSTIGKASEQRSEEFRVLRQALGYSVWHPMGYNGVQDARGFGRTSQHPSSPASQGRSCRALQATELGGE